MCEFFAGPFYASGCLTREGPVLYPPEGVASKEWRHYKWPHIIFMVSTGSGACRGNVVLRQLKGTPLVTTLSLLDVPKPHMMATLEALLREHVPLNGVRVVAAGGDGTCSWVASMLADACELAGVPQDKVPLAVLPIGTGNELARNTGWGAYHSGYNLSEFLVEVAVGKTFMLDTWNLNIIPDRADAKPTVQQLICFCSAGFDAAIAWKFHHLRETSPESDSVMVNKAWHVWFGVEECAMPKNYVQQAMDLFVDGVRCEIPTDINTVQILNVPTGGDGTDYFRANQPSVPGELQRFHPQCMGDGLLEVVGTAGVNDLLAVKLGTKHAHRIAQGRHVQLVMNQTTPIQQEGEPKFQDPCTINITHKARQPVVIGPGKTYCVPPWAGAA